MSLLSITIFIWHIFCCSNEDYIKLFCFKVNDFRRVSLEMMDGRREKLTGNQDNLVGRIEFLPVLWYSAVHDDLSTGVDRYVL